MRLISLTVALFCGLVTAAESGVGELNFAGILSDSLINDGNYSVDTESVTGTIAYIPEYGVGSLIERDTICPTNAPLACPNSNQCCPREYPRCCTQFNRCCAPDRVYCCRVNDLTLCCPQGYPYCGANGNCYQGPPPAIGDPYAPPGIPGY